MKNEKIFKNPDLIPLLIKYVKVNKVVFPVEKEIPENLKKLNIYLMKKL